ncbi:F0F1 ATP synthase subunit B [Janthinobacterium sp. ROICE36]|uniref:F0F1 ATP synthase subunit B family protein n=1 Tax=Janthinobacterium sp. ROICE36 TaxID=2048670 RepID=UPI000C7F5C10|nr:F0F1 ATP synthase subunit B [Janthinobacterium sp. ROICE36]PLY39600.1 F0F1 ATP synthase subunit B [Janthinobacterium sp. ROICE36]
MLIDWFTVGAQTLNFLILVWLLKHFLYQPVLDAIDAREKAIAATVANTAAKEAKAQTQQAEFAKKNTDFDAQRGAMLAQATAQAQAERERLMGLARAEADTQRAKCQNAIEDDYAQLRTDIARRARDEVLSIVRKILVELADVKLEQKICDMFMQRLRALDGADKATMLEALKAAGWHAQCRSSGAFSAQQKNALVAALDEVCASKTTLAFETAPQLVSGIELDAQGYKLAWNIDDYLASFGEHIDQAVRGRALEGTLPPASASTGPAPAEPHAVNRPEDEIAARAPAPTTPAAA